VNLDESEDEEPVKSKSKSKALAPTPAAVHFDDEDDEEDEEDDLDEEDEEELNDDDDESEGDLDDDEDLEDFEVDDLEVDGEDSMEEEDSADDNDGSDVELPSDLSDDEEDPDTLDGLDAFVDKLTEGDKKRKSVPENEPTQKKRRVLPVNAGPALGDGNDFGLKSSELIIIPRYGTRLMSRQQSRSRFPHSLTSVPFWRIRPTSFQIQSQFDFCAQARRSFRSSPHCRTRPSQSRSGIRKDQRRRSQMGDPYEACQRG
jgi:hypothetical protein